MSINPNYQSPPKTPTIMVVFGITGDLAIKKVIPSLWLLFGQNRLPESFAVIGFARRDLQPADFINLVRESVDKKGGGVKNEKLFAEFVAHFSYSQGSFEDGSSFQKLAQHIESIEQKFGLSANKLFYLSVLPTSYEAIFKNLADVALNLPHFSDYAWSRILIEKPFGYDLPSAQALQKLLSSYFNEDQVYRIDHYLFKEIIRGIEDFRFSNNLFEKTWNNGSVERIDIRLYETIGVENRGNFYDSVGALRDVGQNHLLAMLAAVTMECPRHDDLKSVLKNRAVILENLKPWTVDLVKNNTFRAQYRGYKNINRVRPDSDTETYYALKTELMTERWSGVPIFMEAGKRLDHARKEIVLTLKHAQNCLLCQSGPHEPNRIVFRLEPNDEIVIHFWIKKPGFDQILEERTFSFFLYEKLAKMQYVEDYSKIIHAAIVGQQTLFVSEREVEASWRFIDPIINVWKLGNCDLVEYEPDTTPVAFSMLE